MTDIGEIHKSEIHSITFSDNNDSHTNIKLVQEHTLSLTGTSMCSLNYDVRFVQSRQNYTSGIFFFQAKDQILMDTLETIARHRKEQSKAAAVR